MAFMSPPPGASGESFTPILAYKAPAGRLFVRDRVQNASGDWETTETDITMAQPAFALDFGRLEVGWCHFTAGAAPQWNMVPYGQKMPDRPPSPGKDDRGKDLNYRNGFRLPVAGNAIGGVRELAGNSNALITGMNEVHTQYEAAPEAAMGKIPVVKMVDVIAVRAGQSTNFQPVFEIVAWVDRPDVLGPRTVPAPRAPAPVAPPVAPPVVNGHPGYTAAANGGPPQAARQAAAQPEKVKVMADAMPF